MLDEKSIELNSLARLSCAVCEKDIYDFYDTSSQVLGLSYELKDRIMSSVLASKALLPGRIVVVNNCVIF